MYFPNISGYLKAKHEAGKLPHIEVDEVEFIRLAIASGMTEEKAKQAAFISREMGAHAKLGDSMVKVKEGVS